LSKDRLKRLKALEARRRPPAVVVDYDAAARLLEDFLHQAALVMACWVPQPVEPESEWSPAMRQADQLHERLMAAEREAQQAKGAAKLERRAKRRLEAARAVEPPTAAPPQHGLPEESSPAAAAAAPVAAEPVPLATLRY
jgi:hypothetical protein